MKQQQINQAVQKISQLYAEYGEQSYEEKCTQLQHAQQCGTLALEWGLDQEVALAAFLHDIGHFIAQENSLPGTTSYGYAAHDQLGADFLQLCGFSSRLVLLIREHVAVKRYLAATKAGYLAQLSHASTVTLQQQGGPMNPEEAELYAKKTNLKEIILLRTIDDSGKLPEMACKPLSYWLELAKAELTKALA
ncbi:MAG: HD domain-containing protein [Gammaproteobacteria bacterium]|nr:HD domain-containing protein [Gammaproteobacteria bacterium]